jgi:hypothetical protein
MTDRQTPIGFLGFGEAGFHLARGLRRAGAPPLMAFDINTNRGTAETADFMIGRVLQHGERRAHEMGEVAETLRAAGIEPLMAEAIARRQDWEAALRSEGRLDGPRPETADALLKLLIDDHARSPSTLR